MTATLNTVSKYTLAPATITTARIVVTPESSGIVVDCALSKGLAKLTGDILGEPITRLLRVAGVESWDDMKGADVNVLFYPSTLVVAGLAHIHRPDIEPFLLPDVTTLYPPAKEWEPFPIYIDYIA